MSEFNSKPKIVILHGNHGTKKEDAWYTSVYNKFISSGYEVNLETHEENIINSRVNIIKTLKENIKCDENTIIIGHSSGAEACMRYAELYPVLGLVLVTPYVTHMGNDHEKESGYFDYPWKPSDIQNNVKWIIQLSSDSDPFISYREQSQVIRRMLRKTNFDYTYYKCIDMHHIGKKFKSANFIFHIVNEKCTFNQVLTSNIVCTELNENNENVDVTIEKVIDGVEEDLIEIKSDNPFYASWRDNILPISNCSNLNLTLLY